MINDSSHRALPHAEPHPGKHIPIRKSNLYLHHSDAVSAFSFVLFLLLSSVYYYLLLRGHGVMRLEFTLSSIHFPGQVQIMLPCSLRCNKFLHFLTLTQAHSLNVSLNFLHLIWINCANLHLRIILLDLVFGSLWYCIRAAVQYAKFFSPHFGLS